MFVGVVGSQVLKGQVDFPSLSCLVSLKCTLWEGFFCGACRSRPTLYRAEHHTPVGRVLRSCALEPISGRCAALTHVLPVLVTRRHRGQPPRGPLPDPLPPLLLFDC